MNRPLATLDVGNTNSKGIVWRKGRVASRFSFATAALAHSGFCLDLPSDTSQVAIASVVPSVNGAVQSALQRALPAAFIRFLGARDALPIEIAYRTPNTLGADRIAAALGARARHPLAPALVVVDAGTAVTYEVLVGSRYLGGAIAPGPILQLEALARGTAQLPHVHPEARPDLIGSDTASSIASGAWWGFVDSVNGMIARLRAHLDLPLTVVLTGGWSEELADFVTHDEAAPDLVHEGLVTFALHRRGSAPAH